VKCPRAVRILPAAESGRSSAGEPYPAVNKETGKVSDNECDDMLSEGCTCQGKMDDAQASSTQALNIGGTLSSAGKILTALSFFTSQKQKSLFSLASQDK